MACLALAFLAFPTFPTRWIRCRRLADNLATCVCLRVLFSFFFCSAIVFVVLAIVVVVVAIVIAFFFWRCSNYAEDDDRQMAAKANVKQTDLKSERVRERGRLNGN